MAEDRFQRAEMLLGDEGLSILKNAHVAVFGVGGVGGYVCEALARSGVGHLTIVDKDTVDVTNINRQIIALTSTIGRPKVEVMKERILDINPGAEVEALECFYLPKKNDMLEGDITWDFGKYDYVVDAVDNVTAKLSIVEEAVKAGTPVMSSMGAGSKLDPTLFRVVDIYKTEMDPLAKVMRRELRKRGIKRLKVVYSTEKPAISSRTPGSIAFVPPVAGLIIAGEVIRDLISRP